MQKPKLNIQSGNFKILAGWLIDGTGEPALKNVLLEISNNYILSINGNKNPNIKNFIDLSNYTIMPGLIDSHVHLAISGIINPDTRKKQVELDFNGSREVISKHLIDHLSHGIVALRDGGDGKGYARRYKREYLNGLSHDQSEMILCVAGKAWHARGRYGKILGRYPLKRRGLANSILEDIDGLDHIKIINSGINSIRFYGKETLPQFSNAELKEAIKSAGDMGLKTMVHANGKEPVKMAIDSGCHSIEHGYFMGNENLKRMGEKGIFWVPTLYPIKALCEMSRSGSIEADISKRTLEHQIKQVEKAQRYGVNIAVGTDSGSPGVDHGHSFYKEAGLLMEAGLSVETAVRIASHNGAVLLGIGEKAGRLACGMPATFIIVRGGPDSFPKSLSIPEYVFIRGKLYRPNHVMRHT